MTKPVDKRFSGRCHPPPVKKKGVGVQPTPDTPCLFRSVVVVTRNGQNRVEGLQCPTCVIIYTGYTQAELLELHRCPGADRPRRAPGFVEGSNGRKRAAT